MKKIKKISSWLLRALIFWFVNCWWPALTSAIAVLILMLPLLLEAVKQEVPLVHALASVAIISAAGAIPGLFFPFIMLSISLLLPAYREQKGIAKVWGLDLSNNSSPC